MRDVMVRGGPVMPAIVAGGLMLWTQLVLRAWSLRRAGGDALPFRVTRALEGDEVGHGGIISGLIDRSARALRTGGRAAVKWVDVWVLRAEQDLGRHRAGIRTVTRAAPLLGLLGTVGGMIQTFTSLTGRAVDTGASVAGGISEALVSTQLGLLVAIPGIILGRLLDRRETRLRDEVHRARELLLQAAEKSP